MTAIRCAWSYALAGGPRGLALAREKGWLLAWDDQHWLYLLNHAGALQAQWQQPGSLVAAGAADDGSAYAAVGSRGEVFWLAPDLMPRWERAIPHRATAVALDPLGQYLAVADVHGTLFVFDRHGRPVSQAENPRPLHHLAFVPAAPYLLGSSDYGLVACFDLAGRYAWRDGLVAHIGSIAVNGDGSRIVVACYTEGLQSYSLSGARLGRLAVSWPCRLASMTFDGRLILVAWLTKQLLLLDAEGRNRSSLPLEKPIAALALGALGDSGAVALAEGPVLGLDLRSA